MLTGGGPTERKIAWLRWYRGWTRNKTVSAANGELHHQLQVRPVCLWTCQLELRNFCASRPSFPVTSWPPCHHLVDVTNILTHAHKHTRAHAHAHTHTHTHTHQSQFIGTEGRSEHVSPILPGIIFCNVQSLVALAINVESEPSFLQRETHPC